MPKTIYDPYQGKALETLEVITVAPPLQERVSILQRLMHGGLAHYGSTHPFYSSEVTGLYEARVEDGAYGAGTVGYVYLKKSIFSKLSSVFQNSNELMTIQAGTVGECIEPEPANKVAAVLLHTALQDHPSVESFAVEPEVELPITNFIRPASKATFVTNALQATLLNRYPWLADGEIENYTPLS